VVERIADVARARAPVERSGGVATLVGLSVV